MNIFDDGADFEVCGSSKRQEKIFWERSIICSSNYKNSFTINHSILHNLCSVDISKSFPQLIVSILFFLSIFLSINFARCKKLFAIGLTIFVFFNILSIVFPWRKVWGYLTLFISWFMNFKGYNGGIMTIRSFPKSFLKILYFKEKNIRI